MLSDFKSWLLFRPAFHYRPTLRSIIRVEVDVERLDKALSPTWCGTGEAVTEISSRFLRPCFSQGATDFKPGYGWMGLSPHHLLYYGAAEPPPSSFPPVSVPSGVRGSTMRPWQCPSTTAGVWGVFLLVVLLPVPYH